MLSWVSVEVMALTGAFLLGGLIGIIIGVSLALHGLRACAEELKALNDKIEGVPPL